MRAPHLVPDHVRSLEPFALAGVFDLTEVHLAATLATADPDATHEVLLGAALAARAPLHGSVCVELDSIRDTVVSTLVEPADTVTVDSRIADPGGTDALDGAGSGHLDDDTGYVAPTDGTLSVTVDELDWPDPGRWATALAVSPLVRVVPPAGSPAVTTATPRLQPLVLDGNRLYLARHWHLERYVAADLIRRAATSATVADPENTATRISHLFGVAAGATGTAPDEGQLGAATAVAHSDLVVIAGGPGTGKTTTVAHLLAGLLWKGETGNGSAVQLDAAAANDRIALVAPTGKAAARMTEALRDAVTRLAHHLPATVTEQLTALEAVTIHRLLGRRGAGFWHGPDRPLRHDLVIVDEVSMVSLSLMAHLLAAIPSRTKVVLVGDPYQLASVEAGTVLGDIVGMRGASVHAGEPVPPLVLGASVRSLTTVHRQKAGSAILELATAIRDGRSDEVVAILSSADPAEVCWVDRGATEKAQAQPPVDLSVRRPQSDRRADGPRQPTLFEAGLGAPAVDPARRSRHAARMRSIEAEVRAAALHAVTEAGRNEVEEALRAISSIKVLCALRRGDGGVDHWNRSIEDHLREAQIIGRGDWYAGRPTMVTENDYLNRVFNGDVGVALPAGSTPFHGADAAGYQVVFPRGDGTHVVPALRLDRVATQWAMSIHKSQGSEFPHAVVVLPAPPARILTRELLYTAVTRAKERLTIIASEESVRAAVDRPVARASGLAERLV